MMIKQGDAYNLEVKVTNSNYQLNLDDVDKVEIFIGDMIKTYFIGDMIKTYPGDVTYDEEKEVFLFPLSQGESFMFKPGKTVTYDVRVRFKSGEVTGTQPQKVDVIRSMSKAVLK